MLRCCPLAPDAARRTIAIGRASGMEPVLHCGAGGEGLAAGRGRGVPLRARRLLPRACPRGGARRRRPRGRARARGRDPGDVRRHARRDRPAACAALGGPRGLRAARADRLPLERPGAARRRGPGCRARPRRSASSSGAGESRRGDARDRRQLERPRDGRGRRARLRDGQRRPASCWPSACRRCPRTTRTGWPVPSSGTCSRRPEAARQRPPGRRAGKKSGGRDFSPPPQLPRGSYFFFFAAFFLAAFFFAGMR